MYEQIRADLNASMKAHDAKKTSVIRMLLSAIKYEQMEQKVPHDFPISNETVIKILGREIKKRNEAIALYMQGGRPELAAKEKSEIDILQTYLPEQLPEDGLKRLAQEAVTESGATSLKQMGDVMKVLMPKIAGKADGKTVSNLVRNMLS